MEFNPARNNSSCFFPECLNRMPGGDETLVSGDFEKGREYFYHLILGATFDRIQSSCTAIAC